jgi:hypothetical protein
MGVERNMTQATWRVLGPGDDGVETSAYPVIMKLERSVFCLVVFVACSDPAEPDGGPADLGPDDSGVRLDLGVIDGGADGGVDAAPNDLGIDGGGHPDAEPADLAGLDAENTDTSPQDGGEDVGPRYNCGLFSQDPGWTVAAGFRAVVIADSTNGFSQPVAATFAEGPFGGLLYVVDQGNDRLYSVDVLTGEVRVVVTSTAWSPSASLLTAITWDEDQIFDGNLYVADQGSDSDGDSRIYRVNAQGVPSTFVAAPGPGLDDVFALTFAPPGSAYPPGLYVAGDTDGAGPDWGRYDTTAAGVIYSEVSGIEGAVFDRYGRIGGQLLAARPLGGGYSGDGTLTTLAPDGTASGTIAAGLGGVHAPAIAPGGAFGRGVYAASWSTNRLYSIEGGVVNEVASGLSLSNYDANILAFSSDGNVLFVADRAASRIVCIEPIN